MIRRLFTAGASAPTTTALPSGLLTNLSAWWNLDETTGTRVNQVSPGTLDLSVNGTINYGVGLYGNAATNNSSVDNLQYIHTLGSPPAAFSLAQNFSAQVWLRFSNVSVNYPLICNTSWGNYGFYWYLDRPANTIRSYFNSGETGNTNDDGVPALAINTWHHFVFTYNTTSKVSKVYVNGTLYTNRTGTFSATNSYTRDFCVGSVKDGFGEATALYDNAAWWGGRELSAGDVTSLYNGGLGVVY